MNECNKTRRAPPQFPNTIQYKTYYPPTVVVLELDIHYKVLISRVARVTGAELLVTTSQLQART